MADRTIFSVSQSLIGTLAPLPPTFVSIIDPILYVIIIQLSFAPAIPSQGLSAAPKPFESHDRVCPKAATRNPHSFDYFYLQTDRSLMFRPSAHVRYQYIPAFAFTFFFQSPSQMVAINDRFQGPCCLLCTPSLHISRFASSLFRLLPFSLRFFDLSIPPISLISSSIFLGHPWASPNSSNPFLNIFRLGPSIKNFLITWLLDSLWRRWLPHVSRTRKRKMGFQVLRGPYQKVKKKCKIYHHYN